MAQSAKALVFDFILLVFWTAIFLIEFLVIQDMLFAVIALIGVFVFSALLGRDIRRRRGQ
jgi:uncharacterized membrane protein